MARLEDRIWKLEWNLPIPMRELNIFDEKTYFYGNIIYIYLNPVRQISTSNTHGENGHFVIFLVDFMVILRWFYDAMKWPDSNEGI